MRSFKEIEIRASVVIVVIFFWSTGKCLQEYHLVERMTNFYVGIMTPYAALSFGCGI